METSEQTKMLLFISKELMFFQTIMDEFRKLINFVQKIHQLDAEIIDINDRPEMVEKYKIEVLPTLIIGSMRFVGQLKAEEIVKLIEKEKQLKV